MTEDILKALQNCVNGVGSVTEFSQQSNVTIDTVTKYLTVKLVLFNMKLGLSFNLYYSLICRKTVRMERHHGEKSL